MTTIPKVNPSHRNIENSKTYNMHV